ncbi:dTDP-4-amino-4,6-dideoxygalactose transaminase [Cyclonatronum proteinivorum]|uniref:dTDP-4-amino-4,6-dideoxygalactose transaminase n=2 Tax=Cyclonatronum proteinivorum TaxID=1457365 RepID=A0A345UME5_9BACT|nr:dTDP-4-amino-4,6-dideoxygalactose transaminase [Cyclonatronum proteinivorum]
MGGQEIKFVQEAFDTNWVAPVGPHIGDFEQDLRSYTGAGHCSVLGSGSAAIHIGQRLLGVERRDVVLCQSFTFVATANSVLLQGATPVFVDSELETWNMCPVKLEEAIIDQQAQGKRVASIIPVHLYGMPSNMPAIMAVADKYGIPVFEDAAESLGSHINGKHTGTFGKGAALSFNGNKIITTSGGGALISDDEKLIQKARFWATQARDEAPHYEHSEQGYNYRMSNVVAAIGRGQMQVLPERIEARRANHDWYFKKLGETWLDAELRDGTVCIQNTSATGIYFLREPEGYFSNRWLTTVIVNPEETGGITRETIRLALDARNIEARPLWKPMHLQPLFSESKHYGNGVSDWLFEHGLCLPSGSNLGMAEFARIEAVLDEVFHFRMS